MRRPWRREPNAHHFQEREMPQWKKWASAAALAASAGGWLSLAAGAEPLKVGFIYVSPIGDAGWTFQHDSGRKEMEKALAGR
jgi:simple sugar transport system substrate-binding protein